MSMLLDVRAGSFFWDLGAVLFFTVFAILIGVLLGSSMQKTYGVPKIATSRKDLAAGSNTEKRVGKNACDDDASNSNSSSNTNNKKRDKNAVYKLVSEQSVDKYITEHEPEIGGNKDKATASSSSPAAASFLVPRHIAVIMDGNRRFGQEQHNDPLKGHWSGGETLGEHSIDHKSYIVAAPPFILLTMTNNNLVNFLPYRQVLRVVSGGRRGDSYCLRILNRELAPHSTGIFTFP